MLVLMWSHYVFMGWNGTHVSKRKQTSFWMNFVQPWLSQNHRKNSRRSVQYTLNGARVSIWVQINRFWVIFFGTFTSNGQMIWMRFHAQEATSHKQNGSRKNGTFKKRQFQRKYFIELKQTKNSNQNKHSSFGKSGVVRNSSELSAHFKNVCMCTIALVLVPLSIYLFVNIFFHSGGAESVW